MTQSCSQTSPSVNSWMELPAVRMLPLLLATRATVKPDYVPVMA